MKYISAEIIADSVNPSGGRLTTFVCTFPRFILAEINTHRMLSRNSASSRAIPIQRQIEMAVSNIAGPIRWGKNGKGMQDHGEFVGADAARAASMWAQAADSAIYHAKRMLDFGLHKQIVNRVLEPYTWQTAVISATEWENFFALRVHKDAQPEFQRLAYLMLRAYVRESNPTLKQWGEWHVPYGDHMPDGLTDEQRIKFATARAAWVSYNKFDKPATIGDALETVGKLTLGGHWSPAEHCAVAAEGVLRSGNFTDGWAQYRKMHAGENRRCNLLNLLEEYEREQSS